MAKPTSNFKKNVPVVSYEDIRPYIHRIANGETCSNILSAEPVTEFYLSSGTSGGQPKFFPVTAETIELREQFITLLTSLLNMYFGYNMDESGGKILKFMFARPEIETPSGLKARSVSTSALYDNHYRNIISNHHTSPIEAIFCSDTKQSMYCQLLVGLIRRDEVLTVTTAFAATLIRVIKFLEDHWKELCSDIRSGGIGDWITDSGCRNAVSTTLKPNPQLADLIENTCSCTSWEGIIKKLWTKAKFIETITTGTMSQYVETLEFYSGGIPIASTMYVCSEALCGINLELLDGPSNVSYTLLSNMAYFEFLPISKDNLEVESSDALLQHGSIDNKGNHEDIEPVDLVDVKLDQCYELLLTTSAGLYRYKVDDVLKVTDFHKSTPRFQFVERKNVVLSVDSDKTSESDLLKGVTEAKIPLDTLGFILSGYTSYVDVTSIPGHYVLFWELKPKAGYESPKLDPKIMGECCHRMEEALDFMYKRVRKRNGIGALEIRVIK